MQAMRSSYDIITTIVEVLLYDPLHEWTLTPSKAQHIQVGVKFSFKAHFFPSLYTLSIKSVLNATP